MPGFDLQRQQQIAREAHALEDRVRELVRTCPEAAASLETKARKFDTDRIPPAIEALRDHDPAAAREAAALTGQIQAMRWELVADLGGWIRQQVYRYIGVMGMEEEDAIQLGRIGAFKAACRWDPDRDVQLTTYSAWWIRAVITRSINDTQRTIRLANGMAEKLYKARQLLLDDPSLTDEQLAEAVGCAVDRLQAARAAGMVDSLDGPAYRQDDEGATLAEVLPDADAVTDDDLAEALDLSRFTGSWPTLRWAAGLTAREAKVIELRWGLTGREPLTLQKAGEALGSIYPDRGSLSRERARQLEAKALHKLREHLIEHGLPPLPSDPSRLSPRLPLPRSAQMPPSSSRAAAPRCPVHPERAATFHGVCYTACQASLSKTALRYERRGKVPGPHTKAAAAVLAVDLESVEAAAWSHAANLRGLRALILAARRQAAADPSPLAASPPSTSSEPTMPKMCPRHPDFPLARYGICSSCLQAVRTGLRRHQDNGRMPTFGTLRADVFLAMDMDAVAESNMDDANKRSAVAIRSFLERRKAKLEEEGDTPPAAPPEPEATPQPPKLKAPAPAPAAAPEASSAAKTRPAERLPVTAFQVWGMLSLVMEAEQLPPMDALDTWSDDDLRAAYTWGEYCELGGARPIEPPEVLRPWLDGSTDGDGDGGADLVAEEPAVAAVAAEDLGDADNDCDDTEEEGEISHPAAGEDDAAAAEAPPAPAAAPPAPAADADTDTDPDLVDEPEEPAAAAATATTRQAGQVVALAPRMMRPLEHAELPELVALMRTRLEVAEAAMRLREPQGAVVSTVVDIFTEGLGGDAASVVQAAVAQAVSRALVAASRKLETVARGEVEDAAEGRTAK